MLFLIKNALGTHQKETRSDGFFFKSVFHQENALFHRRVETGFFSSRFLLGKTRCKKNQRVLTRLQKKQRV